MSAAEIIEQIKELPPGEQAQIARFMAGNGAIISNGNFSVAIEADGLPVILGQGGVITSQFVKELEALTV